MTAGRRHRLVAAPVDRVDGTLVALKLLCLRGFIASASSNDVVSSPYCVALSPTVHLVYREFSR